MKKSKTISKIYLWVEYIGVSCMPLYVCVASVLILVFYNQFVQDENITDFIKKDLIPIMFALLTVIILPSVFRWCINETKNIEADLKKLKDNKDGTF